MEDRVILVGGGCVLAIIAVLIYFAAKDQANWSQWCRDQGGRVDSSTHTAVGIGTDSKGQPVTTTSTSTTYYCLTADGRVLDVR